MKVIKKVKKAKVYMKVFYLIKKRDHLQLYNKI